VRYSIQYTSILSTFLLLLFTGCGSKEKKISATQVKAPPPLPVVQAHVVKIVPVGETLELAGTLIANESTEIFPEISGRLTMLNVAEGRTVSKGTLLGKIYDGDLRAQLQKLEVQLKVQEQTIARYEELLKINGVSRQEYDMIRLQSSNIRADMEIVRSNIKRTEIRAPFSGTLGLRMVSPGAYVTPQTMLTTIRQTSTLKLDFTVPEKYTSRLEKGKTVDFKIEGSDATYRARIAATESGISEADRSLKLRAEVLDKDKRLFPGTFVKVMLAFEEDTNAIMIPSGAVIPQARTKQVALYSNGIVNLVDVTTGIRDSAMVQITEGLKVNDTIITTGLMRLKSGDKVKLANMK
jgi:membrane fusion protein (multidrug efflux system)